MRLFASLVPAPAAVAHLDLALAALRGRAGERSTLRWTDPDQWHLTLAFYGEVPDGAVPELAQALADRVAAVGEPRLRLRGAGSFAGRNLWVGVAGESEADSRHLADLVTAAVAAGGDVGVEQGPRPRRRAHVTLGRVRGDDRGQRRDRRRGRRAGLEVADAVRALAVYAGPSWPAGAVRLVRSSLGEGRGGGPLHEVVATLPLRASGGASGLRPGGTAAPS